MLKRIALTVPAIKRLQTARDTLLRERDALQEHLSARKQAAAVAASPFSYYHASFDVPGTIRRHALERPEPRPGYLTNFLGVRVDPAFFPSILDGRAGEVDPLPIPANWHADIAEWAAGLRAVELARDRFTMVELGCGWGCWMNNLGVAARRLGLAPLVIGVEGDAGHVAFARETLAANGFAEGEHEVHHAVAAAEAGVALFPKQAMSGVEWGLEPILAPTPAQRADAARSGRYSELPVLSLPALAARHGRIDLVHIDIQGGEADLIEACLPGLAAHVAYVVVGTHSRTIEGRLFAAMLGAGWRLEVERPAILDLGEGGPSVTVDGVQGWRNPVLLP